MKVAALFAFLIVVAEIVIGVVVPRPADIASWLVTSDKLAAPCFLVLAYVIAIVIQDRRRQ